MTAIDLIYPCLPQQAPPEIPADGVCCVTGEHGETIARKHGILDSFTNLDLLRAPQSDRIGIPAWRVLQYTVAHPDPAKKRDLRPLQQSAWICDGESLALLDRQGVRERVIAGVQAERWCGYATTSYKKHGALRAPINTGQAQVWLFEQLAVDCTDRTLVADYWSRMRDAQDHGIHRPLIEQLDVAPGYIGKIGWRRWIEFERWARPCYKSPLYQFIAYLLPSMEELREHLRSADGGGQAAPALG